MAAKKYDHDHRNRKQERSWLQRNKSVCYKWIEIHYHIDDTNNHHEEETAPHQTSFVTIHFLPIHMQKNPKIELRQTHEEKPETMNQPMRSISIDTYRKNKEYGSTNDRPFLGDYLYLYYILIMAVKSDIKKQQSQ